MRRFFFFQNVMALLSYWSSTLLSTVCHMDNFDQPPLPQQQPRSHSERSRLFQTSGFVFATTFELIQWRCECRKMGRIAT